MSRIKRPQSAIYLGYPSRRAYIERLHETDEENCLPILEEEGKIISCCCCSVWFMVWLLEVHYLYKFVHFFCMHSKRTKKLLLFYLVSGWLNYCQWWLKERDILHVKFKMIFP